MCYENTPVAKTPVTKTKVVFAQQTPELKEISIDVVATVVNYLILACESTTTLDVKNSLRFLGFRATQAEVSELVDGYFNAFGNDDIRIEIDGENNVLAYEIVTEDDETFRVYSFVPEGDLELEDEDNCGCNCDVCDCEDEEDTIVDVREYIKDRMTTRSDVIAQELGISRGSVSAIKANITRGR
jgi:predicted XRE-type DNA-binding protein